MHGFAGLTVADGMVARMHKGYSLHTPLRRGFLIGLRQSRRHQATTDNSATNQL